MTEDEWLQKELALSQRHEELVLCRETILRGTERFYDEQKNKSSSFISDIKKARQRNKALLQDVTGCLEELRQQRTHVGTPKFNTLKNNYWSMVKNVFPVWMDEAGEQGVTPQQGGMSQAGMSADGATLQPQKTSPRQGISPMATLQRSSPPHSARSRSPPHSARY